MNLTLEYLAGFFDGEGYVGVICHRTQGGYFTLRASLVNTNKIILQTIQRDFGGKIGVHDHKDNTHRKRWTLTWHGNDAKTMIRSILPFSIVKANEIRLALDFPIGAHIQKGTNKAELVNKEKQQEIYSQLRKRKLFSRPSSKVQIGLEDIQVGINISKGKGV